MDKIKRFVKKETVLSISFVLALISAFFIPPDGTYISYIDFRVLALLFSLMTIMAGLNRAGVFYDMGTRMLSRTENTRQLTAVLVALCFVSSMFVTNDVALITFVPFAVMVLEMAGERKHMIFVVVLQTVAANLGSMMTPVGNPQNLYLYSVSKMAFGDFIQTVFPYTALSFLLLSICILAMKKEKIAVSLDSETAKREGKKGDGTEGRPVIKYALLFLVCLGTVLHLVPYQAAFLLTLVTVAVTEKDVLRRVDYSLLLTFVFFFVFIGNMGRIPAVAGSLEQLLAERELEASILASQVISNVPAAILLSGFTDNYRELLLGVNIGGLGTLIASLASLISYRYYVHAEGSSKPKYMAVFTAVNAGFLVVLTVFAKIIG